MKNKKLLTRLFALLASLVLVLALALPCFADETDQLPTDYIYKRVYSFDELRSLFVGPYVQFSCIAFESIDSIEFYSADGFYYSESESFIVSWSHVINNGEFYIYQLDIDADSVLLEVRYFPFNGTTELTTYDASWSDIQLYILVPADDSSTPSEPTEGGWYGEIKNIIKDAVFGQDAVLNDSQEFTINQISLWLTLIVILLPLIVVGVILVRCFR